MFSNFSNFQNFLIFELFEKSYYFSRILLQFKFPKIWWKKIHAQ